MASCCRAPPCFLPRAYPNWPPFLPLFLLHRHKNISSPYLSSSPYYSLLPPFTRPALRPKISIHFRGLWCQSVDVMAHKTTSTGSESFELPMTTTTSNTTAPSRSFLKPSTHSATASTISSSSDSDSDSEPADTPSHNSHRSNHSRHSITLRRDRPGRDRHHHDRRERHLSSHIEDINEPYGLREQEKGWRFFQPFLKKKGYELRRRYQPGWIGSWIGHDVDPLTCEDSIVVVRPFLFLDASCLSPFYFGTRICLVRTPLRGSELIGLLGF